jgi:hypothetical protein
MGSTTPVFAFPYPVGTDRVTDGDNAIQALAEKMEAVKGVKTALVAGGGTAGQDADGICVYRLPGQCLLRMFLNNVGAIGANVVIATLPAGLRPAIRCFGNAATLSPSAGIIPIDIQTDGTIRLGLGIGAGGIWGGMIPYPLP